jgi:S-adenosylmethionine decarboxylase
MLDAIARSEVKKADVSPVSGYDENKAWALYTSVDIHNCRPEYIRDREIIKQYIQQLSDILQMKCYGATQFSDVGRQDMTHGCSITQFIDSSLVSGHFAFKSNTAYIDIFSSKYYDPEVISHFTLSFFRGSAYTLNVTVRK